MRKIIFVLFFVSAPLFFYSQEIVRMEPPNWWTGMKDPHLQIMFYGKDIGKLKPSVTYKGVQIEKTSCPENPNYLFIDLIIEPDCNAGSLPILFHDAEKQVIKIDYPLLERQNGSAQRKGFNSSDAIYLITPDRFSNAIPENDNVAGMPDDANRSDAFGRHGGDLKGIANHFDYIADLGFTSIWLNPVLENNMPRHSYHGYAITDFYKTDPRFGTNESYKNLCTEASRRNIKVIKDMVLNHCGLEHWWMKDLPTKDWINYQGMPYVQTNHRKTLSTDPYAAEEDAALMMRGWFVRTMPDLNLTNHYLGKYMIQNSIWWIEYAGLSGIRMDTYPYPDEDYMSEWSRRIMEEYPYFNIVGEVWYEDPAILSFWQKGKNNTNGYVSYLPSLCDFPLQSALTKSLMTSKSWEDGWMSLYETLAKDFQYSDPQQMVVFADNHDMSRIYTQVKEDIAKFKMALAFIMTVRGIPQIYYGTEVLMSNRGTEDHGVIRSDFPGGWKGDTINAFIGTGLSEQQNDAQKFVQQLLNWRKDAGVIHHGKTKHFVPENNVYVFFRYDERNTVMIILNKNEQPVTLDLARFKSMLTGASAGRDVLSGNDIGLREKLLLHSAGPLIVEIDK